MGDLNSILSGAQSSLAAQRGLTATASHNIDNANTPGYARQRANLQALSPAEQVNGAFIGRGATLGSVTQARDLFLERQMPQALGSAAFSTAESDALQSFHGLDPQAPGGLSDALSGFYSGLRALSQNPGDPGLRASLVGAASVLAGSFNRTASGVEAARTGLDAQVAGFTESVNGEATAVAALNAQIHQARASGAEPNDLLDERQQHLDALAELTGASQVPTSGGDVNVVLGSGAALVSGAKAGKLSSAPDPANRGHLALTLNQLDGSSAALDGSKVGGSLGGSLQARDGALKAAGVDVNALAKSVGTALNAVHATGAGLDGSTGLQLFDLGAAPGQEAENLTLNSAILQDPRKLAAGAVPGAGGPAASGDSTNLQALLGSEATLGVQGAIANMTAAFGGATATAKASAGQDAALKDHLTGMRDSFSGVSIDEEVIAMQQAQRGYEAITKVIKTADEMMQTLMNIR